MNAPKRIALLFILAAGVAGPTYSGFISLSRKSGTDEAHAKLFSPDPNKALVYAFRANAFKGKQAIAGLIVNDKVVAENRNNQFSVIAMAAGTYTLGCASDKEKNLVVGLIHNKKKAPVSLTVEAGHIYYVQQVFKATSGFVLELPAAETAQALIKKAELSEKVELK